MSSRNTSWYVKKAVLILSIIVLLVIIKNTIFAIFSTLNRSDLLISLKEELYTKSRENEYLSQKLHIAKTDGFIEEEARTKLGFIKNGEQVIIEESEKKKDVVVAEKKPNYQKWLALFSR